MFACALFDWGGFDAVHGWGGFSPTTKDDGSFYGMGDFLAANVAGIFAIAAWSAGFCSLVFVCLKAVNWLRVDDEIEEKGMDAAEFNSTKCYRSRSPRRLSGNTNKEFSNEASEKPMEMVARAV